MEIICPECQFSREVDETKIPARSQVATCPKCQTKFKFRELPEEVVEKPAVEQAPAKPSEPVQSRLPIDESEYSAPTEPEPEVAEEPVIAEPLIEETPSEPEYTGEEHTAEPREGLWDKLDSMSPPQETQEPEVEKQHNDSPPTPEQQPIPGWTGEFNSDFPDPYLEEKKKEKKAEENPTVPPPFEQLDKYGFFRGLVLTVKLVLTSPRLFFSVMPVGGGLSKPLTFTILLTMIQGLIQYFWGMVGLSASVPEGESMTGMSGALTPVLMLLFMPAFIAAGQFVVTGVYHLLLMLVRADHKGFEGTFRALAYANAPIILGIFPMPIQEIEIGWMIIVAFWGLFLTVTGLKYIHKTSYAKVIPVCIVPLLLAMIGGLLVFQSQIATI